MTFQKFVSIFVLIIDIFFLSSKRLSEGLILVTKPFLDYIPVKGVHKDTYTMNCNIVGEIICSFFGSNMKINSFFGTNLFCF